MFKLLAHAGEVHAESSESLAHYLQTWYIALIVFVVGLYLLASLGYYLTKKSLGKTMMIVTPILLIVGLTTYETSPVISVLSITTGFGVCATVAFSSLVSPQKTSKK